MNLPSKHHIAVEYISLNRA